MMKIVSKSLEEVEKLLDDMHVSNRRYNREQFEKFFCLDSQLEWLVLYDEEPVAMCVLTFNCPTADYVCISEVQAFQSGHAYGRKLLEYVFFKKHKRIWLTKDMFAEDSLLHYYRSFGLDEFKLLDKNARRWRHLFCKGCNETVLRDYFKQR